MQPLHTGVIGDDSQNTEIITWADAQELTRLIARLPSFWPIYRWFNQWNKERFWYACIIVSFLRSWFTIFNPKEDFESMMYMLCEHMENKWVWNPKSGGYVSKIWEEFCSYINSKYPDKKIWMTRVEDGSSAMWGCIKRNIPVITAYYSWSKYSSIKSDWVISEEEAKSSSKWTYWHCVTFTWLWPMWIWREIQDNYDGRDWNTYKIYWFPFLKAHTWQTNCFFVILPQEVIPVPPNLRHKYA